MLESARVTGRSEARDFDRRLSEAERQAREARLASLQENPEQTRGRSDDGGLAAPANSSEIRELIAFRAAVLSSRGWRFLQAIRRTFGRAW